MENAGQLPTRAAVFFDLSNMFNNISRVEFFDIIATSFPELLPLTKLFYSNPGNVFHKWVDGEWKILHMEEGSSQGCPLSPILAAIVVVRLLQPIDQSLRQRDYNVSKPASSTTTTMEDVRIYLVSSAIYPPSFLSKTSFSYATNFTNAGFPLVALLTPGRHEYSHLPTVYLQSKQYHSPTQA